MKGFVYSKVLPDRLNILITERDETAGEPVLSRYVKIPYKCDNKSGFILGRIVHFNSFSTFYNEEQVARMIDGMLNSGQRLNLLKDHIKKSTFLTVEVELVGAFCSEGRMNMSCPVEVAVSMEPVQEQDIENILAGKKSTLYYVGTYFGTNIVQPIHVRDFQEEGHHTIVAGQTGSGKSTFVMMLMTLFAKASKNMNFIIFDTVGEFSKTFGGIPHQTPFWQYSGRYVSMQEIWKACGRDVKIYRLKDMALHRWDALEQLMIDADVMKPLNIVKKENTEQAVKFLVYQVLKKDDTKDREGYTLKELYTKVDQIVREITEDRSPQNNSERSLKEQFVEATYKGSDQKKQLLERLSTDTYVNQFKNRLIAVFKLFDQSRGQKSIDSLVYSLLTAKGQTIVIDLSDIDIYSGMGLHVKNIQQLFLKELVDTLNRCGKDAYKDNKTLNTMVVLEEAHNWIPSRVESENGNGYASGLATALVNSFRETRKFGIGWLSITTKVSAIKRDAFEQARIKCIGVGLTSGTDLDLLKEHFGKEFLDTYRLFPDPSDPLSMNKKSCFMIQGILPVISRNQPEYIEVFDNIQNFLACNQINLSFG